MSSCAQGHNVDMRMAGAVALAAYELHQRRRGLMASTVYCRGLALRRAAEWLAPVDLLEAAPEHLEAWLDGLDLCSQSRAWKLSTLSCFYAFAVREGYVESNPVARMDRPRLRRYLPRPIAADDLRFAFAGATAPRLRAWLSLGALAGLRCCEIAGLTGPDVVRSMDPPMLFVVGKGAKPRTVPMARQVERHLLASGIPASGPVFVRKTGGPFSACQVSQTLNYYLHSLGITSTAHSLRHYFATRVYAASGDLRLTQELLGHSDVASTAAYTAWSPARAAEVVRDLSVS